MTLRCTRGSMIPLSALVPLVVGLALARHGEAGAPAGNLAPVAGRDTTDRYELHVDVLAAERSLAVRGRWAVSGAHLREDSLTFLLSAHMRDLEVRVLEPSGTRVAGLAGAGAGDRRWTVVFDGAPAASELVLEFSYRSDTVPAPQLAISPDGAFAGGSGELWYPQIEFATRDRGRLVFTVPDSFEVVAAGRRVGASDEGTPESTSGSGTRVVAFEVERPSKFAFAAAPYTVYGEPGDPLRLYLIEPRDDARVLLDSIGRGFEALRRLFGPVPFPSTSLVEVDFPTVVSGTSEYGFILADRDRMRGALDLPFWLHELGHQWWGVAIRSRSGTPGRMVLSEGIAEFGAWTALEEIWGPDAAERYRRGRHPTDEGEGARQYFHLAAAGLDRPLATEPQGGRETVLLHELAVARAPMLFLMLSDLVGRDRFVERLRSLGSRVLRDGPTSWDEFRAWFEEGAKGEPGAFFDQWFERAGAPTYRLEWARGDDGWLTGEVLQSDSVYDAVLELEIRGEGSARRHRVRTRGRRTRFRIPVAFEVEEVEVDPDFRVLAWRPALRAEAEALAPYTRGNFERRFGERDEAVRILEAGLQGVGDPDTLGVAFRLHHALGRTHLDEERHEEARSHFEEALAQPARPRDLLPWSYLYLAEASSALSDSAGSRQALRRAVTADLLDGAAGSVTARAEELRKGR